jgi:DNA invertase Pin-like site-specific DNA recombinase
VAASAAAFAKASADRAHSFSDVCAGRCVSRSEQRKLIAVLASGRSVRESAQRAAAQITELKAANCERIFQEKASGAKSDRKQLAKLMAHLETGDVVVVTRLDRLARSMLDLLTTLNTITKAGAGFKSLRDTWADTTTAQGRLMVNILGSLAEFKRELIMARTGEGRKRAMADGVKFGRPAKLTPHQKREALKRREAGETHTVIARDFNVSHQTIGRLRA